MRYEARVKSHSCLMPHTACPFSDLRLDVEIDFQRAADDCTNRRRETGQVDAGGDRTVSIRIDAEREIGRRSQPLQHADHLSERAWIRWDEREVHLIENRSAADEEVRTADRLIVRNLHIEHLDEWLAAERLEHGTHLDGAARRDPPVLRRDD